jgi:hypothetical protein
MRKLKTFLLISFPIWVFGFVFGVGSLSIGTSILLTIITWIVFLPVIANSLLKLQMNKIENDLDEIIEEMKELNRLSKERNEQVVGFPITIGHSGMTGMTGSIGTSGEVGWSGPVGTLGKVEDIKPRTFIKRRKK